MTEEDYTSLLPPGTSVHVLCTPAENVVEALSRVADSMGAKTELPAEVYAPLAPPGLPDSPEKPLTAASIGQVHRATLHDGRSFEAEVVAMNGLTVQAERSLEAPDI